MAENLAETVEQIEKSQSLELQGKISAAFALAQSALEAALETGQPGMVSRARMRLAAVHYRLGHDEQARCLAEQVLGQPPLPDTPSAIARVEALLMLGMCLDCPDYVGGREELYHQAIDLSRQAGYCLGLLRGLHNLAAGVYLPRGQFDLALAADAEALHVARSQDLKDYA